MTYLHSAIEVEVHPDRVVLQALRRVATITAATLALVLAGGCAALPTGVNRPHSQAITDVGHRLGRVVAASIPDEAQGLSGLRLLADGDQALDARLALIDRAQTSLDVQYYQIASDAVGLRFLHGLQQAAARGVRVRLLVDDLYAAGQDPLFAALAAQPGFELRMFNPLPVRDGSVVARVALSLHQFDRINRRMHNKLFIADGVIALAGGRNIADGYFMRGAETNFIDMDVMVVGAAVPQLGAIFDRYWNSDQAWPIQALVQAGATADAADLHPPATADAAAPAATDRFGRTPVAVQLDAGRLALTFARVHIAVDDPAKAAGTFEERDTARAMVNLAMAQAQDELMIVSPYFVPGDRGMALLQSLSNRRTRLSVLTNSLEATDEPLVHAGYAKYRTALLAMGVQLHELGVALSRRLGLLGELHASAGRLHAKVAVIDRRVLVIGSMNMDGRSAVHNTEISLLIDSPELAVEAADLFRGDVQASAYRLCLSDDARHIEWSSQDQGREVRSALEPARGLVQGLRLSLLSALIDEDLL